MKWRLWWNGEGDFGFYNSKGLIAVKSISSRCGHSRTLCPTLLSPSLLEDRFTGCNQGILKCKYLYLSSGTNRVILLPLFACDNWCFRPGTTFHLSLYTRRYYTNKLWFIERNSPFEIITPNLTPKSASEVQISTFK